MRTSRGRGAMGECNGGVGSKGYVRKVILDGNGGFIGDGGSRLAGGGEGEKGGKKEEDGGGAHFNF